ncbi:hypothetical protein HMPREF9555_01141 [Selenomonas artemidis F0399]|uniref:Uncharacterized protein n=1 Tax=Selenomonas artemidis F0399 TaxID=749551 RepID=E7N2D0_9FIRM|nr:hypothetical protein HMPREF9555_01141 [Selenomonas artemidis F0399]
MLPVIRQYAVKNFSVHREKIREIVLCVTILLKIFFSIYFLKNFWKMFAFSIICDKIMPVYFLFSPFAIFVLNQVELNLYELESSESCFLLLNVAKMKNIQVFLEI